MSSPSRARRSPAIRICLCTPPRCGGACAAATTTSDGGEPPGRCVRLKTRADWLVHVGLAALGLLSAWMMLSAAELESASFSVWIYGLANWLVFTDAIDFAIRLYVHRWHTARAPATETSADGRLSIDLAPEACGGTRGPAPPPTLAP